MSLCLLLFALAAPADVAGLGPTGPVEKVAGGFKFTEGPAADADGNVYFTDIPNERVHKLAADGTVSVFREKSQKANGLAVNARGEVVACLMGAGKLVVLGPDGKDERVLADSYQGKRLNSTNDLVLDRAGGVYFTDPEYQAPKPLPQGKTCVYYRSAGGEVTRLIDDLRNPNGVLLSPDEATLYVIPSSSAEMMAYPVLSPGKIGAGKVFCTLKQPAGKSGTGGDGLCADVKGNLYITSALGVQVYDPAGKHLGTIEFPEQPANCDFGGKDMKTLYVTARTSLYRVPMAVAGHRFTGKGD